MRTHSRWSVVAVLWLTAACKQNTPEPQFSSSASSPVYAERFPAQLAQVGQDLGAQEQEARTLIGELPNFPDGLKEPNWSVVGRVYRSADSEGQSSAYVERLDQSMAVTRFFVDENQAITGKVAGSVRHAAKQKGCDPDVAAPVGYALNKTVGERLEERLRDQSDAQRLVVDEEESLGKANVEPLQKQADALSRGSYVVNVGLVRSKLRLRSMLEEQSNVQDTLGREGEQLNQRLSAAELPKDERKRLEARSEAVKEASARLEADVQAAKEAEKAVEDRIRKVQDDYRQALEALLSKVDSSAKEAAKASTP